MHPWTGYKNAVIHTDHRSFFTHSNNIGKLFLLDHNRCSTKLQSITLQELQKEIQRNGNAEETHNSDWTKLRISVCNCINTQKSFSFTLGKKQPRIDLKSIYLYKICHNWKPLDFSKYMTKNRIHPNKIIVCKKIWALLALPLSLCLLVDVLIFLWSLIWVHMSIKSTAII